LDSSREYIISDIDIFKSSESTTAVLARYGCPSEDGANLEYFIRITRRLFWITRVKRLIHFNGIPAIVSTPIVDYRYKNDKRGGYLDI
jgi:hypothetical protein